MMCIATPGKVTEINGDIARVDISGNFCHVDIRLVDVKVGDYVLVHAGCALEVIDREEADELALLFEELEAES